MGFFIFCLILIVAPIGVTIDRSISPWFFNWPIRGLSNLIFESSHVATQTDFSIGCTFPVILKDKPDCSRSYGGIKLGTVNSHVCLRHYTQGRGSTSHFPSALPLVPFRERLSSFFHYQLIWRICNWNNKQVKSTNQWQTMMFHKQSACFGQLMHHAYSSMNGPRAL